MISEDREVLAKVIRNSKARVHPDKFAMVRLKSSFFHTTDYFLIAQDEDETTVVLSQKDVDLIEYDDIQKWFRLVEIAVSAPFLRLDFYLL